jgi:O-antigen/teichoic acid export membrane protein
MNDHQSGRVIRLFWRVLGNFFGKGVGFVATALIARRMGPTEFGHVRIVLSMLAVFLVFSGYQVKTAISTYCAQYPDQRRNLYAHGMLVITAAICMTVALATIIVGCFDPVKDTTARSLFLIGTPVLFTFMLGDVYKEFLQGVGRVKEQTLLDMASGAIKALFVVGFVLMVGPMSLNWLEGRIIGEIIAFILLAAIMNHYFRLYFRGQTIRFDRDILRRFSRYYAYSIVGSGLSSLQGELPTLLIMWFVADTGQVAYMGVALLFLSALGMFGTALISSVFAEAARLHRDREALLRHIGHSQRLGGAIFIPVVVILFLITPWLIPAVFGPDYSPCIPLVRIILAASVFQNVSFINGGYWLAIGNIRLSTIGSAIFFILSIGATVLGIWRWGLIGMAWGVLASRVLISGCSVFMTRRWVA